MKARDLLMLAAVGAGVAWVLSTQAKAAASAIIAAPGELGSRIGLSLYDWIHPASAGGITSTTYIALFPDGMKHAIDSALISSTGKFTYSGRAYQMKVNAATGERLAVPV